jgi:hypothetical protein
MDSDEILGGGVNSVERSEDIRDIGDHSSTPYIEKHESADNRHIPLALEEIESNTQAPAEEAGNCFRRHWTRYRTVLTHIIIWVLSTS